MINYRCPKCNDQMSVPSSLAGQTETCPSCGNVAIVPPLVAEPPAAPDRVRAPVPPAAPSAALGEGRVLWSGTPSWKGYVGSYIACGVLFLVFCVVAAILVFAAPGVPETILGLGLPLLPIVIVARTELYRRFTQYKLTEQILWVQTGVLSRNTQELPVAHVNEIQVAQGFIDRILSVGRICFSTASTSGIEMTWVGIDSPAKVRDLVRQYIR